MSTGDNQNLGVPNSKVMVNYAGKIGIKKSQLIEEDKSRDTVTNIIYSWDIIRKYKFKKIVVVTYDLHTRRMISIAKKINLIGFDHISIGSAGGPAYGIKTWQTHSRLTIFIYELLAYVYNRIKGEI